MTTALVPGQFEVELLSGAYLDVTAPDHHALRLGDIATPLAKTCRYGGACEGFFSVAEHAVLVATKLRRLGAPLNLQLAGLHHDDPEFCLSDIQRPVKLALRSKLSEIAPAKGGRDPYAEVTTRLEHAIWRAFGRDGDTILWSPGDEHHPLVKDVDNWACSFEAKHIMRSKGEHWDQTWRLATRPMPVHDEDTIYGWEWQQARDVWLALHFELATKAVAAAAVAA